MALERLKTYAGVEVQQKQPLEKESHVQPLEQERKPVEEREQLSEEKHRLEEESAFIDKNGVLVIPFGSAPRYHWWSGGQGVLHTLLELGARDEILGRYMSSCRDNVSAETITEEGGR